MLKCSVLTHLALMIETLGLARSRLREEYLNLSDKFPPDLVTSAKKFKTKTIQVALC